LDQKIDDTFLYSTSSIIMQSLGKVVQRAPAVGAENMVFCFFTGRMPRSGKLPVLNLHTGEKPDFWPVCKFRSDSLHRFTSNWGMPTGNVCPLACAKFQLNRHSGGGECGHKISNISTFWTPLTDFENF